jgi:SAM-dependent methyltransferase
MKLCKVYGIADAHDPDPYWQELLSAMCPEWRTLGPLHRKYWEWGLGLYGLRKLGLIRPDSVGLSVGAGVEWPLFYLANHVRRVHATDLYSAESHYSGLDPTVGDNGAQFAPFPYRRESLVFQRMNALKLEFPDNTFDFVFSFSSIEHFGGHYGAVLAIQEIARVLKPGGVAAIATEMILDGPPHYEFFQAHEIEPCFVAGSGLELVEPLDLSVEPELISNPVRFEVAEGFQGYTGPHSSVRCGNLTFTSVEFLLRKPQRWKRPHLPSRGAFEGRPPMQRFVETVRPYVPPVVRRAVKKLIRRPSA